MSSFQGTQGPLKDYYEPETSRIKLRTALRVIRRLRRFGLGYEINYRLDEIQRELEQRLAFK